MLQHDEAGKAGRGCGAGAREDEHGRGSVRVYPPLAWGQGGHLLVRAQHMAWPCQATTRGVARRNLWAGGRPGRKPGARTCAFLRPSRASSRSAMVCMHAASAARSPALPWPACAHARTHQDAGAMRF